MNYVYFPTTSIISLLYLTENGGNAETAVIGSEGMLRVSVFMDGESTPGQVQAVVQTEGYGVHLNKDSLKQKFERSNSVRQVFLRYTQALLTHMAQMAVCNRHHSVEQPLCRWLLLNLDRLSTNIVAMMHESLATKLGVCRECVTDAAGKLRNAGLISYNRGQITVLDRSRLEDRICECYGIVKNEFDRLLTHSPTAA